MKCSLAFILCLHSFSLRYRYQLVHQQTLLQLSAIFLHVQLRLSQEFQAGEQRQAVATVTYVALCLLWPVVPWCGNSVHGCVSVPATCTPFFPGEDMHIAFIRNRARLYLSQRQQKCDLQEQARRWQWGPIGTEQSNHWQKILNIISQKKKK